MRYNDGGAVMDRKKKVEIYSAGCLLCQEAINEAYRVLGDTCEITVLDTHDPKVAARAKELGVKTVPAIFVEEDVAQKAAAPSANVAKEANHVGNAA